MTQIIKSIRILVAALACLWPLVFVAGLPAAASVLPAEASVQVSATGERSGEVMGESASEGFVKDGLRVFQHHEPSFFLDAEAAVGAGTTANGPSEQADSQLGPQLAAAGEPVSLGMIALAAVLLLAAFNARKRRSRTALAQS